MTATQAVVADPSQSILQPAGWPSMRGNHANDGRARTQAESHSSACPRHFPTGNAVFSTPIIGPDERIYVGSADHNFYAFDPLAGKQLWSFPTREVIDSAACLAADGRLYLPSGDACLYGLDLDGQEQWRFDLLAERAQVSLSTIYWWEANAVVGPNGWIYAGNDDFHLYAIEPGHGVRWSARTALHIWGAPAFFEGLVLVTSFDTFLYAFDQNRGRLVWKAPLGNFSASSPAVDAEGRVFVGGFDHRVQAFSAADGAPLWSARSDGPVYASAALSEDGRVVIGSGDGCLYCYDAASGRQLWRRFLGESIRSSAAIGADPHGRSPYLVYVGGGDGRIHALEADGSPRWSYDTVTPEQRARSCAINASIALGRYGLATASSTGEIIYLPYHLDAHDHPRVRRGRSSTQSAHSEGRLHRAAPNLMLDEAPCGEAVLRGEPGHVLSFGIIHATGDAAEIGNISLQACLLGAHCEDFEARVAPNRQRFHLIPRPGLPAGRYRLQLHLPYQAADREHTLERSLEVEICAAESLDSLPACFQIHHMAIESPPIVASFDQIGIASLSIDVRIVEVCPQTGKVLAWGVQKFGVDAEGDSVGVPQPRIYTFAFQGLWKHGVLTLESRNCDFEITAFPIPLDRLRFSARVRDGRLEGASLVAELAAGAGDSAVARLLLPGVVRASGRRAFWRQWWERGLPKLVEGWQWLRSLLPTGAGLRELGSLGGSLVDGVQLLRSLHAGRIWQPWGLVDERGDFVGVGSFALTALTRAPLEANGWSVAFAPNGRRLTARGAPLEAGVAAGLLLVDAETGAPLPINYSRYRSESRDAQGRVDSVCLDLPHDLELAGRALEVRLFADLEPVGRFRLDGVR